MIRPCLSQVSFAFLVLLVPAFPASSFVGAPLQREIPYFVDAAVELDFEIDDRGRGTWRHLNDPALQIQTGTPIAELNRALDRYIELLSAGNVEGFLAESGEQNDLYEYYKTIEKFGDDSEEANDIYDFFKRDGDGARILAEYVESHFKAAFKKMLLESAIQRVDMPFTLQELKALRNETPLIAPRTPFSPDFEAVHTPAQEGLLHSQTIRRMTGHGSRRALHRE